MTEGAIGRKILRFAMPLFWGNLFQQLYNIADTLIVGNLLGKTVLALGLSEGVAVSVFGVLAAPRILAWMDTLQEVLKQ